MIHALSCGLAGCLAVLSLAACESPTETPASRIELASSPVPVAVAGNLTFASISASRGMTCARTSSGAAYCWSGREDGTASGPLPVQGSLAFRAVSARCGLATSGDAYCWHWPALTPERMPRSQQFASISGGANLLCGLTAEADLACWNTTPATEPWRIAGGLRLTSLAVSNELVPAFCGIATEGIAYCWDSFLEPPTLVPGDHRFASLSVGVWHRCGIADGLAYCWGSNEAGTLGIGTSQRGFAPLPRRVAGSQALVSLSSGDHHTVP